MSRVGNGLAGLLIAIGLGTSSGALAADIHDAWINVFVNKAFTVTEVKNDTLMANGAQYDTQTIKGTHQGQTFLFSLQKIYGTSSHMAGFDSSLVDSSASSARGVAQRLKLPEAEVTNHARVGGKYGRGATVDIKACRATWFGLRGDASGDGFQYLVSGLSCGDKDDFTRYLREDIRPSTREANRAGS